MTTHPTMTTTFESAMLSFSPGVNSRAELVTLAPGLRPGSGITHLANFSMLRITANNDKQSLIFNL